MNETITLTEEETRELYKYFLYTYTSYEDFPMLILLIKRLRRYIEEWDRERELREF